MKEVELYTDGACRGNPGKGGYGAILVYGKYEKEMSGGEAETTNNRMELTAFLSALESANIIETGHTKVIIYTDSAYVANCINQKWYVNWMKNGWRTSDRQDVKNQDLWIRIVTLYIKLKDRLSLEVVKVKSHGANKWNNYVDLLAVKRRKELEVE